jgi:hypothetical protein
MEGVNGGFLKISSRKSNRGFKKLKDFSAHLSNERRLKNQISYLQQFQSIEIQNYFFNKIGIILRLGKLLTW